MKIPLELNKDKFAAALLKLKAAGKQTHDKAIAVAEAQAEHKRAYDLECKLRDRVIQLYKETISENASVYAWFRLPDGTLAQLKDNLVFFDNVEQL